MTRILCLALAAATVLLPVRAAADKSPLNGTWTVVKAEEDGKPNDELQKAKFTFKDDGKLLIKLQKEDKPLEVTFKLDTSGKPHYIDLRHVEEDKKAVGIWELDADKLKLCIAHRDAKERPTEFKSTSRDVTYVELTRDKK
jgi:uncharacterized protein (TIGR03067 family)